VADGWKESDVTAILRAPSTSRYDSMATQLHVPLVSQLRSMSCWYAAACMVAYYRKAGPRLGLPQKWQANTGISVNDFVRLAKAEGLRPIMAPAGKLTASQVETFLRNFGPLWCAGYWDGVPHIVVLTGVTKDKVFINDPNPARGRRTESLAWFNQKLANDVSGCLMYSVT